MQHKDKTRNYGYVTMCQDIFNQQGDLTYVRDICYAVFKKNS